MNIPLRAPCDQFDLLREPGDAIADVAQRDLFEYFAPPLTEAGSPPLAADLPAAASPNEVTAVGDEDVAWHDQILRRHEEIQDDAVSHHEPQSPDEPDETAAYDRIASATRSEAAALDEASKADLSRLEATLNWLQSEVEACRLPPVPRCHGFPDCRSWNRSSTATHSTGPRCSGRRRFRPGSERHRRRHSLRRRAPVARPGRARSGSWWRARLRRRCRIISRWRPPRCTSGWPRLSDWLRRTLRWRVRPSCETDGE